MFIYINLSDEFTQRFLLTFIGLVILLVILIYNFFKPEKQKLNSYLNEVKYMLMATNFDKKEVEKIIKLDFWETKYKQNDDVHFAVSEYIRKIWLK